MKISNWTEALQKDLTFEEIFNNVRKLETIYWIWLLLTVFIGIIGVVMIINAPANNLKQHSMGVFLALDGCVGVAVIKIWAHIKLSMYRILWINKKQIEAEILKSKAQDL